MELRRDALVDFQIDAQAHGPVRKVYAIPGQGRADSGHASERRLSRPSLGIPCSFSSPGLTHWMPRTWPRCWPVTRPQSRPNWRCSEITSAARISPRPAGRGLSAEHDFQARGQRPGWAPETTGAANGLPHHPRRRPRAGEPGAPYPGLPGRASAGPGLRLKRWSATSAGLPGLFHSALEQSPTSGPVCRLDRSKLDVSRPFPGAGEPPLRVGQSGASGEAQVDGRLQRPDDAERAPVHDIAAISRQLGGRVDLLDGPSTGPGMTSKIMRRSFGAIARPWGG